MSSTTSSTANAAPPTPNLRHAFGGVWRLTFPAFFRPIRLLRLAGLLGLLAMLSLAAVRTSDAAAFFDWTSRYLTFLVPIIAFISGGGTIRDDLKPSTVDYVFTRPLPRPAFLLFKYIAHTAGLQVNSLVALGVLVAVGSFRHVPGLLAVVPLLVLVQVLAIGVFSAFGFLCGTITARHLVVGLTYAGIVEMGIGNIPTQLSRLSLIHHLKALLQPIAPHAASAVAAQGPFTTTVLLVGAAVTMLAIAGVVFGLRELAGARPKEA